MDTPVYLDHAATTPVDPGVLNAMLPFFTEYYGNPSALHSVGTAARAAVQTSRETIAELLNASPEEIVFTSGGTEADNAAIRGAALAHRVRGRHLLTSPTEHHAVLEPMEALAREGWEVEMLPVDCAGRVAPEDVAARIRPETVLVSVMHANNEIGTINPIAEIGAVCRSRAVMFHTDAVQTFGKLPIDVRAMKIDLLSISGHKLYGPKGIGVLYVRRGTTLTRYQEGGQQEGGRRAGTLNVPGIVGLGEAARLAYAQAETENARLTSLRDRFIDQIVRQIPGVHITGSRTERLAINVHICVEGVDGESLVLALDAAGICASAGSACSAGSTEPSHVLKAIGLPRPLARGALRLTLGKATTQAALDYTLETLIRVVADLRSLASR